MNTISKDQSIITQVAAKIAADLTPKTDDLQTNVGNWVVAFDVTLEALLEKHGMTELTDEQVAEVAQQVFPNSVVVTQTSAPQWATQQAQAQTQTSGFQVRVKGKQHGDIPAWLSAECAKKGVTEVWDNRDGLTVNPKRPWFKSTTSNDAFWAPKPRS
jgi:hypothetical protein